MSSVFILTDTDTDPVPKKATRHLLVVLTDEDQVTPLPMADAVITSCQVTLYEKTTKAILNGRDHQEIHGINGGTIFNTVQSAADGTRYNLDLRVTGLDNDCLLTTKKTERHRALIEWWWGSPENYGSVVVEFTVQNTEKVV